MSPARSVRLFYKRVSRCVPLSLPSRRRGREPPMWSEIDLLSLPKPSPGREPPPPSRRTHNLIIVGKPDNPEFTHSMLAACINLASSPAARAVLKLPQVLKNADSDAPSVTLVAWGEQRPVHSCSACKRVVGSCVQSGAVGWVRKPVLSTVCVPTTGVWTALGAGGLYTIVHPRRCPFKFIVAYSYKAHVRLYVSVHRHHARDVHIQFCKCVHMHRSCCNRCSVSPFVHMRLE